MERLPKKITIKAGTWVYGPQQGKKINSQLNADCFDFVDNFYYFKYKGGIWRVKSQDVINWEY